MLRNISDNQIAELDRLASIRQTSRNSLILEAIANYLGSQSPQVCYGYIQIDRVADIKETDECSSCHQELGWPFFVAIYADGSVSEPICGACASSE